MTWGYVGAAAITAGAGYMSSKKNKGKSATQTNSIPAWLENSSQGAVNRAEQLSRRQYTPFRDQRVAGLGANETQASSQASAFGARTDKKLREGFQGSDLDQFENPYLDRVLKNRQRVIGEEYGRQSSDLQTRQSAMDAFRSGRSDLARSRLDKNRLQALDDAEGQERASAFDRAMGAYFTNEGQMQGAFAQSQNALSQTGAAERSIRQAGMDFDYGQFLERRDWDVNNLRPLLDAIGSARGSTSSTMTTSGPNKDYWGAAAGLLGTAITTWLDKPATTNPPVVMNDQRVDAPAGGFPSYNPINNSGGALNA